MGALIVGYGNPLREDDGAGWEVAALAGAHPRLGRDRARVRTCHQLTPELAEDIARASVVVLVDASTEAPPGAVTVSRVEAGEAARWSHHLDAPALAALASELYGATPPMFLVSVGAGSLAIAEGLSPAVEAALPAAVEAVVEMVEAGRSAFSP